MEQSTTRPAGTHSRTGVRAMGPIGNVVRAKGSGPEHAETRGLRRGLRGLYELFQNFFRVCFILKLKGRHNVERQGGQ